jgi:Xaa-Pro aminopeptidase
VFSKLISRWKAERKFIDFICYNRLETCRSFGGIRLEENVVMTSAEGRFLDKKRPRTIDEVDSLRSLI